MKLPILEYVIEERPIATALIDRFDYRKNLRCKPTKVNPITGDVELECDLKEEVT